MPFGDSTVTFTVPVKSGSITPGCTRRPLKVVEDRPKSSPTVPGLRGPEKSESTSCTPICSVNTSLVVARRSNPAEHIVALGGSWGVGE